MIFRSCYNKAKQTPRFEKLGIDASKIDVAKNNNTSKKDEATKKYELDNYNGFFQQSNVDSIDVIGESITFKKQWADPISFKILESGKKIDVYNNINGPIMLESKDISEVMFYTKYIGNYNITKIGNTQLGGAAQQSAKTLGGSFGELKNKIIEATNALLEGGLRDALIDLADKATKAIDANKDFIKSFGADLGRAVTIGADALKLLADNFSLIKDAVITLLIVRLGSALLNLSSAITNNRGPIAAFIRSLFGIGTASAAAAGGITAVSTAASVGPITAFATRMGVLFATLGGFPGILAAIGTGIMALITSPLTLLVAALVGIELGFQKAFNISPIDTMAAKLEELVRSEEHTSELQSH